uniref:AlNc14C193G8490 protein n=1 Tax=Albugo laibachii Nc14 TaxID=890382 RepID=F0WQ08_9STRA|nr:AlNc14C193G8490 [Albugo laibachii Nc14]|eukprot:CCA23413.1 AlNc14C193G8490 [Albugo laibachii Nc14]
MCAKAYICAAKPLEKEHERNTTLKRSDSKMTKKSDLIMLDCVYPATRELRTIDTSGMSMDIDRRKRDDPLSPLLPIAWTRAFALYA